MVPLAALRRAAAEALAFLRAQPDVREAEAFVSSNGSLFTRLNYTSHIPSNGLEEPKSLESYGIGVQVALTTPDGVKVGFGSEPSDLTLEGVRSALEKARRGAVLDPEFVSLPRPTGERRTLRHYHDPEVMRLSDGALVAAGWTAIEGGLRAFESSEALHLAAAGQLRKMGLILGGDVTALQERMAIASTNLPRVQSDESTLLMAFLTAMVEAKESKGSGWSIETHRRRLDQSAAVEAARNAVAAMDGQRVPDGEYTVVLGPQPVTDILNNLVLGGLETSSFYAQISPFMGKFGQRVASEELSVIDDSARPGLAGSKGITCEGLPTGRTELIKDGVLVGLMSNYYEAQRLLNDPQARAKLGADPKEHRAAFTPRNGFRFARGGGRHFDTTAGIYPTNVVVEGTRPVGREELFRRVGNGLYIGRIWYTYPINGMRAGDFTCTVVGDSYLIKDGRLAAPLKANAVRLDDNVNRLLNAVVGVGDQPRGTLVWAADEIVHAPEIAVSGVPVRAIGSFMAGGG